MPVALTQKDQNERKCKIRVSVSLSLRGGHPGKRCVSISRRRALECGEVSAVSLPVLLFQLEVWGGSPLAGHTVDFDCLASGGAVAVCGVWRTRT